MDLSNAKVGDVFTAQFRAEQVNSTMLYARMFDGDVESIYRNAFYLDSPILSFIKKPVELIPGMKFRNKDRLSCTLTLIGVLGNRAYVESTTSNQRNFTYFNPISIQRFITEGSWEVIDGD